MEGNIDWRRETQNQGPSVVHHSQLSILTIAPHREFEKCRKPVVIADGNGNTRNETPATSPAGRAIEVDSPIFWALDVERRLRRPVLHAQVSRPLHLVHPDLVMYAMHRASALWASSPADTQPDRPDGVQRHNHGVAYCDVSTSLFRIINL